MSDLHTAVFDAIKAMPRPISPDDARAVGLDQITDANQRQQFEAWFQTNGAQLTLLLNGGQR